jgi:hypothetical protein
MCCLADLVGERDLALRPDRCPCHNVNRTVRQSYFQPIGDSRGRLGRYHDPTTGQFLNADPDVATTGEPYAYTSDDPINEVDPEGLLGLNPISDATEVAGDVGGAFNHDVQRVNSDVVQPVAHWATTPTVLPNSDFFTGTFHLEYGVAKVGTGVILIATGTAADVTGVGAFIGLPVQALGVYDIVSGVGHIYRGERQLYDAFSEPLVCESPLGFGERYVLQIDPGGGVVSTVGGLP